jgi:hypothetical protein
MTARRLLIARMPGHGTLRPDHSRKLGYALKSIREVLSKMKTGDLVKMTARSFWDLKSNPNISYTESVATVIESGTHIMEVMWPDGKFDLRDKDLFEVVS